MYKPLYCAKVLFLLAIGLACSSRTYAQEADRPTAMSLFPGETVLFIRTADARQLIGRLQDTGMQKMIADPALADFVGSLKGTVRDKYAEHVEEEVGLDLDSLLRLPQGELAFGIIERLEDDPAILLVADFRDEVESVESLLERAKEEVTQDGGAVGEEKLRADTAITLRSGHDQNNVIGIVRRGGVFVVASDPQLLASVLDRWDGIKVNGGQADAADETVPVRFTESLDKNRAFASSLRECLQGREEPPQVIAFIDPIKLVRAVMGRETGVRIALATLPALGIDAIEGVAAAAWVATETWDVLTRAHVLIDNPRAGVMQIVRMQGGDVAPPDYVPANVANYTVVNIDPQQVFDDIASVVDRFQGEGSFRGLVKSQVSGNLGADLADEVIPVLAGRMTMLGGYEERGGAATSHTIVAVDVIDEAMAGEILKKCLAYLEEQNELGGGTELKKLGELEYHALPGPPRRPGSDEPPIFSPCVGVFGGAIVISSSEELFKNMIEAQQGTQPRLADDLQYRLVGSRLKRLAGGKPIGVLNYQDPEQVLRHWFTLLQSDRTREFLERPRGPGMAAVRDALEASDLPPVEDLIKYCTPGGTIVYDTDTGFHLMSFSFRCNVKEE